MKFNFLFRAVLKGIALFVALPIVYFLASLLGGLIPAHWGADPSQTSLPTTRIYLVTNTLHADIALPFDENLLKAFPQLADVGLPLDNENLRHLMFGWGSKAFYTTAGSYSDIQVSAVFKAITGDEAVMRVTAAGELNDHPDAIALDLDDTQYAKLLDNIAQTFADPGAEGTHMAGYSIGPYDAFFRAKGHFNLFNPCNQWVNRVLNTANVSLGWWTPTTHSLRLSLNFYGRSARQE